MEWVVFKRLGAYAGTGIFGLFINVNGTFCVVASLMLATGDWLLRNALNLIISYQANIHAVCLTGLLGEKGVTF